MAELNDRRRLAAFRASILKLDGDVILQHCVERAAKHAEAPMAMVSFVMKKLLLLPAAVGLPPELEAARGASRGHSFCQFVVMTEEPFIVTDARRDVRAPRRLVDAYGIAAYAGVPIRAGGHVLGSLSVSDGIPRQWSPEVVSMLRDLAERVSERLETVTALGSSADEITAVPSGSLAARASILAQIVHRSLVEVGPLVRLARGTTAGIPPDALLRAATVVREASECYDEMIIAVAELCAATKRVERSVALPEADR